MAIRQSGEANFPGPLVSDARIVRRREFQCRPQASLRPVDGAGREPLGQEAVAPFPKLGSAQQRDRLVQDHTGQMDARMLGVVGTAAARA
jgi:hypothetical protein